MNTENLSPAMTKAIEAGGTNNTVIGNALVKRGIFVEAGTAPEPSAGHPFRFIPFPLPEPTFTISEEEIEENAAVKLADTIRRDEEMFAEKIAEDGGIGCFPPVEDTFDAVEHISKQEMPDLSTVTGEPAIEAVRVDADTVSWMEEQNAHIEAEGARIIAETRQAIEEAGRSIAELNLTPVDVEKVKFEFVTVRNFLAGGNPIEAKRLAIRTAEMWARVVRLRGEFEAAPEWRKERITAALATMGTVVYPEGTPEHTRYREELTEALKTFREGPARWRITFDRVGRFSPGVVPAFEYNAGEDAASVSARLRSHLSRYLTSKDFSIRFESEHLLIEDGRFGTGTASIIS